MQIPLLGGPLDGKAWQESSGSPPRLFYGRAFGDEKNTVYELRRFPVGTIEVAYVATTLTADEAEARRSAYSA